MNCSNCKIANQNVPCVPQGNDFKLAVVLKEKIKTDGEVSERNINILNNQVSVAVIKPNGDVVDNTQNVYSVALNDSTVIISFTNQGKNDQNGLPKGKYGIEVTGKRTEDSSDFCFSLPIGLAFEIVAYSTQGRFPSDSIITYTVDGVVGVALNVSEGGGGSATVGTLKTDNTSAQTPSASESFGGTINLHKVSKTGSYNDLRDKPTIPDVPSWAMQATKPSYTAQEVGALSSSTSIPSKTSDLTNDSGFLTSSALVGYETKLQIVRNPSTTLTAAFGKYYRFGTVDSLVTITLPTVQDNNNYLEGFIVSITMSDAGLYISTQDDIMDVGLSDLEDGKTYELNFIWNGAYWAITAIELTTYTPQSS